jgi:hypothetical protein
MDTTLFGRHRVGIMYGWIAVGFVCLIAALMVLAIGRGQIVARPRGRVLEISGTGEG